VAAQAHCNSLVPQPRPVPRVPSPPLPPLLPSFLSLSCRPYLPGVCVLCDAVHCAANQGLPAWLLPLPCARSRQSQPRALLCPPHRACGWRGCRAQSTTSQLIIQCPWLCTLLVPASDPEGHACKACPSQPTLRNPCLVSQLLRPDMAQTKQSTGTVAGPQGTAERPGRQPLLCIAKPINPPPQPLPLLSPRHCTGSPGTPSALDRSPSTAPCDEPALVTTPCRQPGCAGVPGQPTAT